MFLPLGSFPMPRAFGLRSPRLAFGSDDVPQARCVAGVVSQALGVLGLPKKMRLFCYICYSHCIFFVVVGVLDKHGGAIE